MIDISNFFNVGDVELPRIRQRPKIMECLIQTNNFEDDNMGKENENE